MKKNPVIYHFSLFFILCLLICNGCRPGEKPPPEPGPSPSELSETIKIRKEFREPLTILYTANLRGNVLPPAWGQISRAYPAFHFSQVQEILRRLKAGEKSEVILIDAGNNLAGYDDFSRHFFGKPMLDLIEKAGYDAVFVNSQAGIDLNNVARSNFVLCDEQPPSKARFIVKEACGIKVGIFVLDGRNQDSSEIEKKIERLNSRAGESGTDFNILLCADSDVHLITSKITGADLIIPLDYQQRIKAGSLEEVNGIPVAPFVESSLNIGKIHIQGNSMTAKVIPAAGADPVIPEDALNAIKHYIRDFEKIYGKNYGTVLSSFLGYGSSRMDHSIRTFRETAVGSFTADAIRRHTGADIAIINHLAIRKDLAGFITSQRIMEAFPFDNEIITLDLTGRAIEEILSSSARRGEVFYQVSGVTLGINPESEMAIVQKDGSPLEGDSYYRTAVIDYLLESDKDKYGLFKTGKNINRTGLIVNYAVFDEIRRFPYIIPPPRRILMDEALDTNMLERFARENSPSRRLEEAEKQKQTAGGDMTPEESYSLAVEEADIHLEQRDIKALEEHTAGFTRKNNTKTKHEDYLHFINALFSYAEGDFAKSSKILDNTDSGSLMMQAFRAIALYRQGKTGESGMVFRDIRKKYPDELTLEKIAGSFPSDEKISFTPGGEIPWRTFGGDFARTGRSLVNMPTAGSVRWKFRTFHTFQSSPAVGADGTIYCAAGDGYLYALKPSGSEKWKIKLGKVLLASPTIGISGTVYAGSDNGFLYALDPEGRELWKFRTGAWVISTPALDGDENLYFGSNDRHFYKVSPLGEEIWRIEMPHEVFSSPALDKKGNLYVGCLDKKIYCISSDGKVLWSFATGGKVYSTPALSDEGNIIFGSDDGFIYALDSGGNLIWKYKTAGFVPASPAVDKKGNVYIGSEDHYFYALDKKGKLLWKFRTDYEIFGSPAIDGNGNICFGSDDTHVYCLDNRGNLLWKTRLEKYVESSPAMGPDGRIYIGSDSGFIYCIE